MDNINWRKTLHSTMETLKKYWNYVTLEPVILFGIASYGIIGGSQVSTNLMLWKVRCCRLLFVCLLLVVLLLNLSKYLHILYTEGKALLLL